MEIIIKLKIDFNFEMRVILSINTKLYYANIIILSECCSKTCGGERVNF